MEKEVYFSFMSNDKKKIIHPIIVIEAGALSRYLARFILTVGLRKLIFTILPLSALLVL